MKADVHQRDGKNYDFVHADADEDAGPPGPNRGGYGGGGGGEWLPPPPPLPPGGFPGPPMPAISSVEEALAILERFKKKVRARNSNVLSLLCPSLLPCRSEIVIVSRACSWHALVASLVGIWPVSAH